jgi:streptogramin lyase
MMTKVGSHIIEAANEALAHVRRRRNGTMGEPVIEMRRDRWCAVYEDGTVYYHASEADARASHLNPQTSP